MTEPTKQSAVLQRLDRLAALCDSGFALAIHIRYTRPSLLYRTYNQAWIDHYSEQGYMLTDPVVHWGLTHTGAVLWADLVAQDSVGVMQAAKSHGLHNGWTYATGPATSRTISGLTKSGADFTPDQKVEICAIVDEVHDLTEGFDGFPAADQEAFRAMG